MSRVPLAFPPLPAAEVDVTSAVADAMAGATGGSVLASAAPHASSITTTALCAHPSRWLFVSGSASGRLHLWQFGGERALATYTPGEGGWRAGPELDRPPAADAAPTGAGNRLGVHPQEQGTGLGCTAGAGNRLGVHKKEGGKQVHGCRWPPCLASPRLSAAGTDPEARLPTPKQHLGN